MAECKYVAKKIVKEAKKRNYPNITLCNSRN